MHNPTLHDLVLMSSNKLEFVVSACASYRSLTNCKLKVAFADKIHLFAAQRVPKSLVFVEDAETTGFTIVADAVNDSKVIVMVESSNKMSQQN